MENFCASFGNIFTISFGFPLFLDSIVFHSREDRDLPIDQLIWYAGALIASLGLNMILTSETYITAYHCGMKMRVAICSIVYRKVSILKKQLKMRWKKFIFQRLFTDLGIATVTNGAR